MKKSEILIMIGMIGGGVWMVYQLIADKLDFPMGLIFAIAFMFEGYQEHKKEEKEEKGSYKDN